MARRGSKATPSHDTAKHELPARQYAVAVERGPDAASQRAVRAALLEAARRRLVDDLPDTVLSGYSRAVRPDRAVARDDVYLAPPDAARMAKGRDAVVRREMSLRLADDGSACRRENRPVKTNGAGGSRPFIPWCAKGKRK